MCFLGIGGAGGEIVIFNEYGKLEIVKPGYQAYMLVVVVVVDSGAEVVSIVSFLDIFFMFTVENGFV